MLWRIVASLIVGVVVWILCPLVGAIIATLGFAPAVIFGDWVASHAEIIGVLAAFAYFIWGRWVPKL